MVNLPLLLTLVCLREPCFDQNSCHGRNDIKACIAENCKKALEPCFIKTALDLTVEMTLKDPSVNTEKLQQQTVAALKMDFHKLWNCVGTMSMKSLMCVLEVLLADRQQGSSSAPVASRDLGYILCWIKSVSVGTVSCFDHYDLGTLYALLKHSRGYTDLHTCFLKTLLYWVTKCYPAYMKIYGKSRASPSAYTWNEMLECDATWIRKKDECVQSYLHLYGSNDGVSTEAKDGYICTFNQMILATAAC